MAFEFGDIRRPFVVGSLYNGQDTPNLGSSLFNNGAVMRRGLISRKGHQFIFFDDPSKAGVAIISSDGNLKISLNETNSEIHISSQGKVHVESQQDMTLESQGNLKLSAQQGISLEAQTNLDLKGNPSVGSRSTMTVGSALYRAVDLMLEKAKPIASGMLEAADADVIFREGRYIALPPASAPPAVTAPRRAVSSAGRRYRSAATPATPIPATAAAPKTSRTSPARPGAKGAT